MWVNICSASNAVVLTASQLNQLEESAPVPVLAFLDGFSLPMSIGRAVRYEAKGEDLWAELELVHGAPSFDRAFSILVPKDNSLALVAVVVTELPREFVLKMHDFFQNNRRSEDNSVVGG